MLVWLVSERTEKKLKRNLNATFSFFLFLKCAGKTPEGAADLQRLALIRKQREEAKLKREQAEASKKQREQEVHRFDIEQMFIFRLIVVNVG